MLHFLLLIFFMVVIVAEEEIKGDVYFHVSEYIKSSIHKCTILIASTYCTSASAVSISRDEGSGEGDQQYCGFCNKHSRLTNIRDFRNYIYDMRTPTRRVLTRYHRKFHNDTSRLANSSPGHRHRDL